MCSNRSLHLCRRYSIVKKNGCHRYRIAMTHAATVFHRCFIAFMSDASILSPCHPNIMLYVLGSFTVPMWLILYRQKKWMSSISYRHDPCRNRLSPLFRHAHDRCIHTFTLPYKYHDVCARLVYCTYVVDSLSSKKMDVIDRTVIEYRQSLALIPIRCVCVCVCVCVCMFVHREAMLPSLR